VGRWLDPKELGLYEPVSRSLRIEGYSTSVRLERIFWGVLDQIAEAQHLSTCGLLSSIYREAFSSPTPPRNFSSVLRVICLRHLERNGGLPGRPPEEFEAAPGEPSFPDGPLNASR
jgi:predicted DNA-binding ribbon-helix-helix protein